MLQAGLPAEQAIQYFTESQDSAEIAMMLGKWQRSAAVRSAQRELLGKAWQEMTLDEQVEAGLKQQYASLAYLCFSTNYITANQQEKAKLDSARTALEAKVAGTSGKGDALAQFMEDLRRGSVKLGPKPLPLGLN